MKGWISSIAAIVTLAALTLAAPLPAAHEAASTPLRIDVTGEEHGTAKFTMIGSSSAYTDSGALVRKDSFGDAKKTRYGHSFALNGGTSTFAGKHGRIVVRTTGKTYFMEPHEVWIGTWTIVRGTKKYAGLKGTGGFTAVHPGDFTYTMRFEGLITRP